MDPVEGLAVTVASPNPRPIASSLLGLADQLALQARIGAPLAQGAIQVLVHHLVSLAASVSDLERDLDHRKAVYLGLVPLPLRSRGSADIGPLRANRLREVPASPTPGDAA